MTLRAQDFSGRSNCRHDRNSKGTRIKASVVPELLQSHDTTWTDEELLFRDEQRKRFLETDPRLVKMVWSLLKWQQTFRILCSKLGSWISSRIWEDWLQFLLQVKCYQAPLPATEKMSIKESVNWCTKLYCLILSNRLPDPSLQQPSPWSISSNCNRDKTLLQQKDYESLKAQMMVSTFSKGEFLIKVYMWKTNTQCDCTLTRLQYTVNVAFIRIGKKIFFFLQNCTTCGVLVT